MTMDDDMIAAYVDGELDGESRALVAAAITADPDIAARAERYGRMRTALGEAYVPVLAEPVPARLAATVLGEPGKVSSLPVQSTWRRHAGQAAALAASLLIGIMVGRIGDEHSPAVLATGPDGAILSAGLAAALERQPSGEAGMRFSFRSRDGRLCRVFETGPGTGLAGVACREPDTGWQLAALAAQPTRTIGDGYRPASADELPGPVAESIKSLIDGDPLGASEENAALRAGWQ